eukprot:2089164-Pleurochrysis_carterae.AAC.1
MEQRSSGGREPRAHSEASRVRVRRVRAHAEVVVRGLRRSALLQPAAARCPFASPYEMERGKSVDRGMCASTSVSARAGVKVSGSASACVRVSLAAALATK